MIVLIQPDIGAVPVLQLALRTATCLAMRTSMTARAQRKEHPLSMRLPEADIAIIDRAAMLRGRSRTDFVREAAVRAAEDVLMESRLIRMSLGAFADFMAVLSAPAAPAPEIVELAGRPAPWEPGYAPKPEP